MKIMYKRVSGMTNNRSLENGLKDYLKLCLLTHAVGSPCLFPYSLLIPLPPIGLIMAVRELSEINLDPFDKQMDMLVFYMLQKQAIMALIEVLLLLIIVGAVVVLVNLRMLLLRFVMILIMQ